LREGDVEPIGANEASEGFMGRFEGVRCSSLGLVAAHAGFELGVTDDGVHDATWRQGGAGVVEVGDVLAAGSICSQSFEVEWHGMILALQSSRGSRAKMASTSPSILRAASGADRSNR
jgi:hypothetical protein